jgi:hypothetical protein
MPMTNSKGKSESLNFTASGFERNYFDESRVAAVQTSTYGGGNFTGAGRLQVWAGSVEGQPSEFAVGETSVYILFQIANAFNYHLLSSVSSQGNVHGFVIFNGAGNFGTVVDAAGTLPPGQYVLQAGMFTSTNSSDGLGIWSYSLSLIPANIGPGKLTAAQKACLLCPVFFLEDP